MPVPDRVPKLSRREWIDDSMGRLMIETEPDGRFWHLRRSSSKCDRPPPTEKSLVHDRQWFHPTQGEISMDHLPEIFAGTLGVVFAIAVAA